MFGILKLKNSRMLTFAAIFFKQLAVPSMAQKGNRRQMAQYEEPV
jgi:hypothetical protein